jgi:hypothetical protein
MEAEAELSACKEQAALIAASQSDLKAGRVPRIVGSAEALAALASELARDQLRLTLETTRLKLQMEAVPTITSTAPAATGSQEPSRKKLQQTLAGFVLLRSKENPGMLTLLEGPKVIEAVGPTLQCSGCTKTFKSAEGLQEHSRHCGPMLRLLERRREETRLALGRALDARMRDRVEEDAASDADEKSSGASKRGETLHDGVKSERPGRRGAVHRKAYTSLFKLRVLRTLAAWSTGAGRVAARNALWPSRTRSTNRLSRSGTLPLPGQRSRPGRAGHLGNLGAGTSAPQCTAPHPVRARSSLLPRR